MELKPLVTVIIFLLLVTTASAMTLEGSCNISFFGESTLHNFDGTATCQPFSLTSAVETENDGIIRQAVVAVLVGDMATANDSRDKKMRAMFDQENFPQIQGLFTNIDPDLVLQQLQATDGTPGHMEFDLRIRDISQQVRAVTRDLSVTPEQISFAMEFPLSLASFRLQPPSVLGLIKVDDQIMVNVRVTLLRH